MYIKHGPVQYDLLQNLYQPQKNILAADITLWRLLEGLYFYEAPHSKYYFGLLKEDCCNCLRKLCLVQ